MTSQLAAGFLVHLYACELWFYSRVYGHSVIDCAIVTIIKYKFTIYLVNYVQIIHILKFQSVSCSTDCFRAKILAIFA